MHLDQMLGHAINCQWDAVNHVRYELFYRMAAGAHPIFDRSKTEDATTHKPGALLPNANDPPQICTQKADGKFPNSPYSWVTQATAKYREDGIVVVKNDRAAALRWKDSLTFDMDVGNRHSAWDWAGNSIAPYSTVIETAKPPAELLAELKSLFAQDDYEQFFRAIVGCPVTVVNCRPVRSLPHATDGVGPQSAHQDGCPPGVIRGVLYLTDVDENNGQRSNTWERTTLRRRFSGGVGDLLVFDAMRLKHRAMPPDKNVRMALDLGFHSAAGRSKARRDLGRV